MRRYLTLYLLYLVIYLPCVVAIGVLEGAMHRRSALSVSNWWSQLGAFAVFFGPWIIVTGVVAVAALTAVLARIPEAPAGRRLLLTVIAGPVALVAGTAVVALVVALVSDGAWKIAIVIFALPVAFLGSAALYAVVGAYAIRRSRSDAPTGT